MTKNKLNIHFLLILAVLFWGMTPSFMKLSLKEIEVFPFNVLRLFVALVTSGIFLIILGNWKHVGKKDWINFIIVSLFGFFVFQFCFPFGVKNTSASIASLLMATLPINVIIINLLSKSEKLILKTVIGILLSFIGISIIILGTNGGFSLEGTFAGGVILLIVAEMGFALYTVKAKDLIHKYSLYQVMFIVILFSFILFLLFSTNQISSLNISNISPLAWLGVSFTGIFGTCLGNIFWSKGIENLGSTKTSIYANLPPVFGIAAGFLILKETLSLLQILGGFVIISGVVLVNRKKT
ncbi:MAG: EamA family transporter [Spirochaetaceae bacterium]|nr:EamA family transporter [Spirochaetaceae bacterium]